MGESASDGQGKQVLAVMKPAEPVAHLPSAPPGHTLMLWNRAILGGQHLNGQAPAQAQAFGVRQALRGHEAMAYLKRDMS